MVRENKGVAWYDFKAQRWLRDLVILLHPPYTMWHLAYVVIGAAMAPQMNWETLLWTLLAFFLGMGICAHCADELRGRPLKTRIPGLILALAGGLSLSGAVVIGLTVGLQQTIWIFPCIIFGAFIVFAYNLESFKGFFHTNFWFGFAWGAFPVITAYLAQTHTVSPVIVFIAAACLLYSMTQRVLSTQARFWRRKVFLMHGLYVLNGDPVGGSPRKLEKEDIYGPADRALKLMTWTVTLAAIGLVLARI